MGTPAVYSGVHSGVYSGIHSAGVYSVYGNHYGHYYGKREAEAEPEADPLVYTTGVHAPIVASRYQRLRYWPPPQRWIHHQRWLHQLPLRSLRLRLHRPLLRISLQRTENQNQ